MTRTRGGGVYTARTWVCNYWLSGGPGPSRRVFAFRCRPGWSRRLVEGVLEHLRESWGVLVLCMYVCIREKECTAVVKCSEAATPGRGAAARCYRGAAIATPPWRTLASRRVCIPLPFLLSWRRKRGINMVRQVPSLSALRFFTTVQRVTRRQSSGKLTHHACGHS